MNDDIHLLKRFAVRVGGGASIQLVRLHPLNELSPASCLLAALLRADKDESHKILDHSPPATWDSDFLRYLQRDRLANLVYSRLLELNLVDRLRSFPARNNHEPIYEQIKKLAAQEASDSARFDLHLASLLDNLGPLARHAIWEKGISLSRSLYKRPEFRVSSDFDILITRPASLPVFKVLQALGYSPILDDPGFCQQLGVGPLNSVDDLFLAPDSGFAPCAALAFHKPECPVIEIKFDPLDRGLRMEEEQRFHDDAININWQGRNLRAPSVIDHLILELVHFQKHAFDGWHWLFDIHLLTEEVNCNGASWDEFVRRCHVEGIESSAWAGLVLAADRLGSLVPAEVATDLRPSSGFLSKTFSFAVSPQFVWNSNCLPMLLLSAYFGGDRQRKLKVLSAAFAPDDAFLASYFSGEQFPGATHRIWYRIIYWLLLVLPAGLVRRTFGKLFWMENRAALLRF